jgi:hypothetical protein
MVPIRFAGGSLVRPSVADIADVGAKIAATRGQASSPASDPGSRSAADFDLVVWAEVAAVPADIPQIALPYQASGATWWIETAKPGPRWWEGAKERVASGV